MSNVSRAFELLIGEVEEALCTTTSPAHKRANDAALSWCLTIRSKVGLVIAGIDLMLDDHSVAFPPSILAMVAVFVIVSAIGCVVAGIKST